MPARRRAPRAAPADGLLRASTSPSRSELGGVLTHAVNDVSFDVGSGEVRRHRRRERQRQVDRRPRHARPDPPADGRSVRQRHARGRELDRAARSGGRASSAARRSASSRRTRAAPEPGDARRRADRGRLPRPPRGAQGRRAGAGARPAPPRRHQRPRAPLRRFPHSSRAAWRSACSSRWRCRATPKLLIADEPTSGLDVTVQAQVLDDLRTRGAEPRHGRPARDPGPRHRRQLLRPGLPDARRRGRRAGDRRDASSTDACESRERRAAGRPPRASGSEAPAARDPGRPAARCRRGAGCARAAPSPTPRPAARPSTRRSGDRRRTTASAATGRRGPRGDAAPPASEPARRRDRRACRPAGQAGDRAPTTAVRPTRGVRASADPGASKRFPLGRTEQGRPGLPATSPSRSVAARRWVDRRERQRQDDARPVRPAAHRADRAARCRSRASRS